MRLGLHLSYSDSFREAADLVVALERVGLDIVWVAEVYGFDAPTQMGYLAARTERVQIGSAVLPIYSRTPALLAQTAAGLDDVSGGRAILGLGVSGPQVVEGWHGVPFDCPLRRTREVIEICRQVWRREILDYRGACYTLPLPPGRSSGLGKPLKLLTHPRRDRIPIYLAAIGERNVALAAEIADGWLPIFVIPEQAAQVWGDALAHGRARRSPELGPLEIVAGGPVAIGDGLEPLRERQRATLALYLGGMGARGKNFYNDLARRYGFGREAERIQDLYLSGRKAEAATAVPDALVEATTLIGPASHVRERIAAYKAAGVTVLNVMPVGPDLVRTIERVKQWVDTD